MNDFSSIIQAGVVRALEYKRFTADKPLKVPQVNALTKYHAFLQSADPVERMRAYFDMATGTGKTGAFSVITRFAHQVAQERGVPFRTVVVEPTTLLLGQTRSELLAAAPEYKDAIGIFGGGSKDFSKPITVMTYDAWTEMAHSGALKSANVAMHISDEAHYGLSTRRQDLINNHLINTNHLGFTASASFDFEKSMERTHRNLVYSISLREALEGGYLADYAHVQFGIMRIMPDALRHGKEAQISSEEISRMKQDEWAKYVVQTYAQGIDEITQTPLKDKMAVMFGRNTDHADRMCAMLNQNPILRAHARARGFKDVAIAIHSVGYTDREQERRLEAFRSGEYMVATGDKKFKEGYDNPRIKFVASYPGSSMVDIVQETGRGSRFYVDPVTRLSQGLVIAETIPYIGAVDQKQDQLARERALANSVTAYELLKGSVVFSPRIDGSQISSKTRNPGSGGMQISPGTTVEVFTSLEDTITVASMIQSSRLTIEPPRTTITEAMRLDLRALIDAKGRPGGRTIMNAVERYEDLHNLNRTGLNVNAVNEVVIGTRQSLLTAQWERLQTVLQSLPDQAIASRMEVTPDMKDDLVAKIEQKGNFGAKLIMKAVRDYDVTHKLADTGLNTDTVFRLAAGRLLSVETKQWQRLHDALDALPDLQNLRTEITAPERARMLQKIDAKGGLGMRALASTVQEYEKDHELEPSGLTGSILTWILERGGRSIDSLQWERLDTALDRLPDQVKVARVEITDAMRNDLNAKIKLKRDLGSRRLIRVIEEHERMHRLPNVGLNEVALNIIRDGAKSAALPHWQRLHAVLDAMPDAAGAARIDVTPAMVQDLKKKVEARGGIGAQKILKAVDAYEMRHQLPRTGLSEQVLSRLISGSALTIVGDQWQRLNLVLDTIPPITKSVRIDVTEEMRGGLKALIAQKGGVGARLLRRAVEDNEVRTGLVPCKITESVIDGVLLTGKSIEQTQWERLHRALHAMPDRQEERLEITPALREKLLEQLQAKGGIGSVRLANLIEAHETRHALPDIGLSRPVLETIIRGSTKSTTVAQWQRVQDVLAAQPDVANSARTDITFEMCVNLGVKIAVKGGFGSQRLCNAVRAYERDKGLKTEGLSDSNISAVVSGRVKSMRTTQWERLHQVLDALPTPPGVKASQVARQLEKDLRLRFKKADQEVTGRLHITDDVFADFHKRLAAKGSPSALQLVRAAEAYAQQQNMPDTGLNKSTLTSVMDRKVVSADANQWRLVLAALDAMPDATKAARITYDGKMAEGLVKKIVERGNLGAPRLAKAISEYEAERGLEPIGLTVGTINSLTRNLVKSVDAAIWERLHTFLDQFQSTRIDFTPVMAKQLNDKIAARGGFGATRLSQAVADYEEKHGLEPVGVTYGTINALTSQGVKTIEKAVWDRLHACLDATPEIVTRAQQSQVSNKSLKS